MEQKNRMMLSVVIPLYNKEQSVEKAIRSVLAQTYTDFEIIVVDDGSTDRSATIVEILLDTDKRIHLIHQPNQGVSAARNTGIWCAKGEYVVFLDADDYWERDVLWEYTRLIHDYPEASLYALGCGYMDGGVKTPCPSDVETNYRGYMYDVWRHKPTFLSTASCCCCAVRTAKQIGGFDTRMTHGEDYDMWWRLLFIGPLAYYNKSLVYYVQDSENRAMHRIPTLENYIPYYIGKYREERLKDAHFRRFCDEELARRLYPYLFEKETRSKAKELLREIDWSLQKPSLLWRMRFPRLYAIYRKLKNNSNENANK